MAPALSIQPGDTVGILGGGQLGRMLASAAAELGLTAHIYCPDDNPPAADTALRTSIAAYDDADALKAFADAVDVVTYEFENVPAETVSILTQHGAHVRPGATALEMAQDRLIEKRFIESVGAVTAPYHPVDDLGDLAAGLEAVGRPAILKTRRLGYDGKGQSKITETEKNLPEAYKAAIEHAWREVGAAPSILEGFVAFEREISVIAARGADGAVRAYEPAENVHREGILRTSTVPAHVDATVAREAEKIAGDILAALDYVGVIGVEFFVLSDGGLVVNEFAPRVHNSGHWTMDACAVSQFEQHIRAVAGWPLAEPLRHSSAVMENLIGDDVSKAAAILEEPGASLHLYGKGETRAGRKMGHVNRLRAATD